MTPPASDYRRLITASGAVRSKRDVVRVFGRDAQSFLQGQITQDILSMPAGESRWSFVLEPKGRVIALFRVWGRPGGDSGVDEILIDVEEGLGQLVVDRLNRFRLRVKAEIELLNWECLSIRGPHSPSAGSGELSGELVGGVDWGDWHGVDVLSPEVSAPEGIALVGNDAMEWLRIRGAWPAMGREIVGDGADQRPIPGELGHSVVDHAVSFTKGCYTGQELVVRTRSRGDNTPRQLRRIELGDSTTQLSVLPPIGAAIVSGGEVRGRLTSVAGASSGEPVALGYVHRSVTLPAEVSIQWEGSCGDGSLVARVPADAEQ